MRRTTYSNYTPQVGPQLSGYERVAIEKERSGWTQNTLLAATASLVIPSTSTWVFEIDPGAHGDYIIHKVQVGCDRGTIVAQGYVKADLLDITPTGSLEYPLVMCAIPGYLSSHLTQPLMTMYSLRPAPVFVVKPGVIPFFVARVSSIGENGARNSAEWNLPTPIGIASDAASPKYFVIKLSCATAVTTSFHLYVEWEERLGE